MLLLTLPIISAVAIVAVWWKDQDLTVSCLKDVKHRQLCRVIFWQEIAKASGAELANYLQERYGR